MMLQLGRPAESEYGPYYAGYIRRVPDGDLLTLFAQQIDTLRNLLSGLSAEQADFRPGPPEWSIKEVVGHINDTERVFAYRALRISRNDQTPLAGFEQDDYVRESNFSERTLSDLLEEFELIRRANILAFNRLSPEASLRCGTASNAPVSVRALLYMMAGHVDHHVESLRQDYLAKL
jgi:hypothetical protein